MKQVFRWIALLAFGGVAYLGLESFLRYFFGSSPSNIFFWLLAILVMLYWLVAVIKVGNWIARTIGLEIQPKKGRPWWYDRHDNY